MSKQSQECSWKKEREKKIPPTFSIFSLSPFKIHTFYNENIFKGKYFFLSLIFLLYALVFFYFNFFQYFHI